MGIRNIKWGFILGVAALFLLTAVPRALAQTPTPATSPVATPTPDFSLPPTMPSGATLQDDSAVCWIDGSDNEEGFEIGVGFCNRSFTYTVGANVTCFELPPEARKSAFPDDCFGAYQFWVSAFNDTGRSFPQVISLPVRKGTAPSPAPRAPGVLPGTGMPSGEHKGDMSAILLAVGSLLVLSGALPIMIGRQGLAPSKRRRDK